MDNYQIWKHAGNSYFRELYSTKLCNTLSAKRPHTGIRLETQEIKPAHNRYDPSAIFIKIFQRMMLTVIVLLSLEVTVNALAGGRILPPGGYPAVGEVGSCNATLITPELVLTAAHCVCPNPTFGGSNCHRSVAVFITDSQGVKFDLSGSVRVHPDYQKFTYDSSNDADLAVIHLDAASRQKSSRILPIPVESPNNVPVPGTPLTLIGSGPTGPRCSGFGGKSHLMVSVSRIDGQGIKILNSSQFACPGDSGGPALNSNGRVVGVANSGNKSNGLSTYTPTAFHYNWIFGQPYSGYHMCRWYEIGAQRSHQPGPQPWCPEGAFLTQFDLDSDPRLSPQDSPIVGRAKCCWVSGFQAATWSTCAWKRVGIQSHQQGPSWCSPGSFMTQFDLDGGQGFNGHDAPFVGQAYCCAVHSFRINQWQRCEWVEVGPQKSHGMNHDWCPDGTFLTQFDLDSYRQYSIYDSPAVGRALCCR